MFEKRLKEISKKIGEEEKRKFYILEYKQHGREIYFTNNKKALSFIKIKFWNSLKKRKIIKRFAYLLIKLKLIQPFLKKISLSSNLGDVIFAGGQIKGFDLDARVVSSFPIEDKWNLAFIMSKKAQKNFADLGFAPEILELNEKIPYSKEELLQSYPGKDDLRLFKRLISFYNVNGIEKKPLEKILSGLKERLEEKNILNEELRDLLNNLSKYKNKMILLARTHGDFSEEQVLQKGGNYVFADWHSGKNLMKKEIITGDLIRFSKKEVNLLENERFLKILEIFPKEVIQDLTIYILLSEIEMIIERGEVSKVSLERIRLSKESLGF